MSPWFELVASSMFPVVWLFFIVLIAIIVYVFFTPLNFIKDLKDVSYGHIYRSEKYRKLPKCYVVQEYRKRRFIGDVPPVYPNGWFAVLDSDQLKAGQLKYVSALGEHLAVFRSTEGQVYILDAFCPHLGANVAVGGMVINDNCVQCPFHGWTFRGEDGKCVNIPYADKIPEGTSNIKKWISYEVNTLIFVWYHVEGIDPSWYPEPIDVIHQNKWWYRGRNEYYVNCHIQEVPENGADVAHLSILHSPFVLAGSDLIGMKRTWAKFAQHTWQASWSACKTAGNEHIGRMWLHNETLIFGRFKTFIMDVDTNQIGPAYVEMNINTTVGPMIILQTVTPMEPFVQKVVHKMFYPLHMSLYGTITFFTERILFERDVIIWNHKTYRSKPVLTNEESSINKHRKWYNQFYSPNSKRCNDDRNKSLSW